MKCTYYPDIDYLVIRLSDGVEGSRVNVTHMVRVALDEDDRIQGLSIVRASRQFRNTDLVTSIPEIAWEVPEHSINVTLSGGSGNGLAPTDKLTLAYFLDSNTLHLEFTEGPADLVVDITNCDIADINTDGTLNGVSISFARELLQIEDVTTYIPEFQWNVHERKRTPTAASL